MPIQMPMAPTLLAVFLLLLMLLLLLLLVVVLVYLLRSRRPCRLPSPSSDLKSDDLERPILSEHVDFDSGQNYDLARDIVEDSGVRVDESTNSARTHGVVTKKRVQSADFHVNQGASLIVDVISDTSEDLQVGQTLKRPAVSSWTSKDVKHGRWLDASRGLPITMDDARNLVYSVKTAGSSLTLEVIAGPTRGLSCSRQSRDTTLLPLTLGRVSPCDLVLEDAEVSGKHALINWNMSNSKWELVDMGSLNGTLLNSHAIHHPDSGSRHWSDPVELDNGDIITLGTSSKIQVQVTQQIDHQIPFGVGVASDPMAMRRGGKILPMEDVCYCQWPLPGVDQFGLFGVFDGHGGSGASKAASKLLPENIASILSDPDKREKVLSQSDASDVLKDAFSLTEAAMNHQYEGCTATVLLIWFNQNKGIFAQCANVGDSTCFMSVNGTQISMTEDHRLISSTERTRMINLGMPLKDGESRVCGINLGRMLGDKFLKEHDARFSSEPYVSQVVHLTKASTAFAMLASDGLWDVIGVKKAAQLVLKLKERENARDDRKLAEKIANFVLSEAISLRTKDNTSVVFLDFDTMIIDPRWSTPSSS